MNRSTLVLLILVLGLGGFYYFYDVRGGKTREEAEKQEKRVFPALKADSLMGLELKPGKSDQAPLVLEKRDGRWIRKGPPEEMVSVAEVGRMADGLVDLQRNEVILESPKPEELKQFGLEKPAFELSLKSGGASSALLVGDKLPDGNGYYARVAPSGPVVTVPGTFSAIIDKTPAALRETSPLPGDPGKAVRVKMVRGGQETELVLNVTKREEEKSDEEEFSMLEGDWKVEKPFQAGADSSKVSAFLWDWNRMRAGRFMQPGEKVDFSKPELRLEVWEDKRTTPQVLEIGPPVAVQPTMRYARRLNPEEVMVLDFSKTEALTRDGEFFRDRHLLAFQVDEVEKVEGQIGSHELVAQRSGENWKLSKPDKPEGDLATQSSALSNLLWELTEEQWSAVAPAGAATGLDKPRARLTLYKDKKEKLGTILLGAQTPDKKGCYVQLEGKPEVWTSESDYLTRWEDSLRTLWPAPASPSPSPSASPAP